MRDFESVIHYARKRKGGDGALQMLLPPVIDTSEQCLDDSFYLAMMCKAINQAGFNWTVIEKKWPEFEEAFFHFDTNRLSLLSPDEWEAYTKDKRVVRHWPKIKAVMENVEFIIRECRAHGSFDQFIKEWSISDQVGLMAYLKKNGSRLGGMTGQWFLRYVGRDSFVLTRDVVAALQSCGLDIKDIPSSKREMKLIQDCFNAWREETGLSYTYLSKIAAFSIGENRHVMI